MKKKNVKGAEQIKRLGTEVKILRQVAEITGRHIDLGKVLDRFLSVVMEETDSDAGSFLLVDDVTDTLYFAAARGKAGERIKKFRLAMGEGIAGWVAQNGMPIITPDASKDKRHSKRISAATGYKTRNMVCIPVKYEKEILGVIQLLNKKGGGVFTRDDVDVIQPFLSYIAVLIKNAGLTIENRKRIQSLEHIMELTKYVNSTLNLDSLLDIMLDISTKMLGGEAGSVLFIDDEAEELVFAAATGRKKDELKNTRVPIGKGIAGWVAREDASVLVPDVKNDPRFYSKTDEDIKFRTKSIIAVPLRTKEKLIGVVEILNKKNGAQFDEQDKLLLEALANQAAVAIENAKLYSETKDMFLSTVKSLAAAIDTKDAYTHGHSEGVTELSVAIGKELGFSAKEIEDLRLAALFHDIGKIGIEESILRKPSKLTRAEYEEIKKHPDFAANILLSIPQLKEIIPVIRHHHERYDGNGYPAGLKGDEIPYHSRIIAIADTVDAMTTDRPYRKALAFSRSMEEVKRCSGTQFDPGLTGIAIAAMKKSRLKMKPGRKKQAKRRK
ncbi:MAG TPA: GAF domain-containing protein [Firmicutes bacterium]|nr:GAF domain-containing protein [Bacillota bacterium]